MQYHGFSPLTPPCATALQVKMHIKGIISIIHIHRKALNYGSSLPRASILFFSILNSPWGALWGSGVGEDSCSGWWLQSQNILSSLKWQVTFFVHTHIPQIYCHQSCLSLISKLTAQLASSLFPHQNHWTTPKDSVPFPLLPPTSNYLLKKQLRLHHSSDEVPLVTPWCLEQCFSNLILCQITWRAQQNTDC